MLSHIRDGGLLAVVLAASAAASPVAVQDVEIVPAVQERGLGLELGTYDLSSSHSKEVLVDLRAGAQIGPVDVAADVGLFIECVDCHSWGTAVVSHSGVTKDEGLLGDLVEFLENPVDAIVSAFDMDVRVDFQNVGGHFEFDIEAEAGASISLSIFESELVTGIPLSVDVSVGLLLAVDLVFSLDAEIDVSAGFEFSLPEGSFITVDPLTGDIVDKSFAGGDLNQLPIIIIAGEATIEACLRVRLQAGTTVEVFGTGFEFELGVYVDLLEYTAVAIGESHNCGLFISEKVDLAIGVYAVFVLEIDYHAFTAVPAAIVVLLELDLPNICLATAPPHHHSASGFPTLPSGTGYPSGIGYPTGPAYPIGTGYPTGPGYPVGTGYPSSSPSGAGYPTSSPSGEGYPTPSSQGYPTVPVGTGYPTGSSVATGAPYPTGTASASGSSTPSNSANGTITASAPSTTSTAPTTVCTITSCAASGLYCPASSSSHIVVTSTKTQATTYPATPTQTPAGVTTSPYPANTPYSTSAPQSLTPVPTPTPSTVYTPSTCTPTNTIASASSYSVLNPGYTGTIAPVYTTYPAGQYPSSPAAPSGVSAPSGVAAPSGYSVNPTGSAPTSSPAPFTGDAARSSGTVVSALAVALFGAVALM